MKADTPSSLAVLQRTFAAAMLTGQPEHAAHLVATVRPPTPRDRVAIYMGGYVTRLREVLETDHRDLPLLVGDAWPDIALDYIRAHPSRHPNLNRFGKALPAFLRERGLAFAADLAELGVAMADAFDAAEFEPMDREWLASIAPEQWGSLVLTPNPSARLVASAWPVDRYYQACVEAERVPAPPEPEPSWTLVFRRSLRVWRQAPTEAEAAVFAALEAGEPLDAALTAGAELDAGLDAGALFGRWCADGLFL